MRWIFFAAWRDWALTAPWCNLDRDLCCTMITETYITCIESILSQDYISVHFFFFFFFKKKSFRRPTQQTSNASHSVTHTQRERERERERGCILLAPLSPGFTINLFLISALIFSWSLLPKLTLTLNHCAHTFFFFYSNSGQSQWIPQRPLSQLLFWKTTSLNILKARFQRTAAFIIITDCNIWGQD